MEKCTSDTSSKDCPSRTSRKNKNKCKYRREICVETCNPLYIEDVKELNFCLDDCYFYYLRCLKKNK